LRSNGGWEFHAYALISLLRLEIEHGCNRE
jgi:hypothetical protein